jgi:hypothetical protein
MRSRSHFGFHPHSWRAAVSSILLGYLLFSWVRILMEKQKPNVSDEILAIIDLTLRKIDHYET